MKNILKLFVTEKCNKRCKYCFSASFKKHFDNNKLMCLYNLPLTINSVQFYGGEPGMLKLTEIHSIFNMLNKYKNIQVGRIYTNGLFFRRYTINDIYTHIKKWVFVLHITSINDYEYTHKYISNTHLWNIVIVLNSSYDFDILRYVITHETRRNVTLDILFPCNFNESTFITDEIYTNWQNIISILPKNINKQKQINPTILKKLCTNISFDMFKKLLICNKHLSNTICESFTVKKYKVYLY